MKISTREREVLRLIAYEFTSKEIAQQLYISNHTALSHRKNLITKLGVRNTAGLVRRGYELGLLSLHQNRSLYNALPFTASSLKLHS